MRKIQNSRAWQKLIADIKAELPRGALLEICRRTGLKKSRVYNFFNGNMLSDDETMLLLLKEAKRLIKESAVSYREILKELDEV